MFTQFNYETQVLQEKQKKTKKGPESTLKPTLTQNPTNHQSSNEGENKTHPNPLSINKKGPKNIHGTTTPSQPHWNPFTHQFRIPQFFSKNTPSPFHTSTHLKKKQKQKNSPSLRPNNLIVHKRRIVHTFLKGSTIVHGQIQKIHPFFSFFLDNQEK